MRSTWGHRAVAVAGVACLMAVGSAAPAQAGNAGKDRVVRGSFAKLPAADAHTPGLSGRAQLVRTGSGKTHLSVHVKGLEPRATYAVHLHNAACSAANPGGGHYQNEPGGPAEPPNELWASSHRHHPKAGITANRAGIAQGHGTAAWIASSDARSVVVHDSGGTKIACADLR